MTKPLKNLCYCIKNTLSYSCLFAALAISQAGLAESEVGNISPDEVDSLQTRIVSKDFQIFGFGPARLSNLEFDDQAYSLAFGYLFESTADAAIKLGLDLVAGLGDVDAGLAALSMGANYYFSRQSFSPYIAGGLGLGAAISSGKTKDGKDSLKDVYGFSLSASCGVAMFRTATTQLQLGLQYSMMLKENQRGKPSSLAFNIMLLR